MLRRIPLALPRYATKRPIVTIAVRCEDEARKWERRTPILPETITRLREKGVTVLVESCEKRIVSDKDFELAGATIISDIREEGKGIKDLVILGIKEIPISSIQSNATYAFFSHTHKGQPNNIKLLQAMINSKSSRFIDYELLTDGDAKRTTTFGFMAGAVGMAEGLSGLGLKALAEGSATPLLQLPKPFQTQTLEEVKSLLKRVGHNIKENGTGGKLGPITIALTGRGRVGSGARSILEELGVEWVSVEGLREVVESTNPNLKKIYACHLELKDYLMGKDGSSFDRELYRSRPDLFLSTFDTKVAPFSTLFVNGGFWEAGCPRILTTDQLTRVKLSQSGATRMLSIVDIACDFDGPLEFITSATTIDEPTINFNHLNGELSRGGPTAGTVQLNSIEIFPSELPLDSSIIFAKALEPYLYSLIQDPKSQSDHPLSVALRRATIVENGNFTKQYENLSKLLETSVIQRRKKVLMLGSGLVASPAVAILKKRKDVDLTIASNILAPAQLLAAGSQFVTAVHLDASDLVSLELMVKDADVVVSLLPATLHARVAELCIKHQSHFVSASYVSSQMELLDGRAKEAGVILLNELGLDPGIDHMSAMRLIDEAQSEGYEIKSFISFCGGLPAPEDSNNALGYKFSWSPRGVLTAALSDARFRIDGKEISILGKELLARKFDNVPILRGFNLEGIANRDSLKYLKEYGLDDNLSTILRGTLRYQGFCLNVDTFKSIGLLNTQNQFILERWEDLVDISLRNTLGKEIVGEEMRREAILSLVSCEKQVDKALESLRELGLLNENSSQHPVQPSTVPLTSLDHLAIFLGAKLTYSSTDRDIVILHHELGASHPSTGVEQVFTSTMVQYGTPAGDSAMAKTVGIPIALGALLCLDGKISARGIVSPASKEIYITLLAELEKEEIIMKESRSKQGVKDLLQIKN